ncbi:ABC transporter ATP-binding protein [Prolixibacteraceae bacterium Z1-6]|uniref:ABC transporter ATP-binding protein n=1 Tax=Draconibacterium aestuarii TaxID=2998507 RepID=A0A9X3J6T4_9BACT|nr:ABC transporter ATP-binding protein [Prolixibacteraceae bacterium Z1-6]
MKQIEIKDLEFKWKGQVDALLKIDHLKIEKGKRFFLQGESGSGKTSLLSLLAGINAPQKGLIELLGQPINKMKTHERDEFRAKHIGYIFQLFNLVPYLSVIENVTLPCQFSKHRNNAFASGNNAKNEAIRLLKHVGLAGKDVLHKPVTELSVGQQQRVAACRALIGNPEIIIADEPTSSLDEKAQQTFIRLLLAECSANETTLIFVSHDAKFSHLFDKSARLENGEIVYTEQKSKGGAK